MGHLYLWRRRHAAVAWLGFSIAGIALVGVFLTAGNAVILLAAVGLFALLYLSIAVDAWRSTRSGFASDRPAGLLVVLALVGVYLGSLAVTELARLWLRHDVAEAYRVPGRSMEPTVLAGEWLFAGPRRGRPLERDVLVVFRHRGDAHLKRIVGLPGDTLSMRDRLVSRNGRPLGEPWVVYERRMPATATDRWGPLVVPGNSVFVLGDNRDNALDSRYIGFVSADSIVGFPLRVYFSRDPTTGVIRWGRIGRGFR